MLAVVGPTATGKTALGVTLAETFGGEVISADSMQLYKGLDVGTAKVTPDETHGIPHHAVDILDRRMSPFSVADFVDAGRGGSKRTSPPGAVCPSLWAVRDSMSRASCTGSALPPKRRRMACGSSWPPSWPKKARKPCTRSCRTADPEAAAAIHPNNQVRVLRALEHFRATGKRLSEQKAQSLPPERPYRSLVLGLDFPDRAQLYRRIDLRVDKMLDAGLLDEAKLVYDHRQTYRTAAQAIGYKEFFPFFEGTAALEECADKLKQASRNYAKRQLTWFRHMDGVVWLDASAPDAAARAVRLTREFLAKG